MRRKCSNCCFADMCKSTRPCEHYCSIAGITDVEVRSMTEELRQQFSDAWIKYLEAFYDEA